MQILPCKICSMALLQTERADISLPREKRNVLLISQLIQTAADLHLSDVRTAAMTSNNAGFLDVHSGV